MTFNLNELIIGCNEVVDSKKLDLISLLNNIIQIASYFDHQDIINWVNVEISGYKGDIPIPLYRILSCSKFKIGIFGGIDGEIIVDTIEVRRSIREILKDSEKRSISFKTKLGRDNYEYIVKRTGFLQIIDGIKARIKEYLTRIQRYTEDAYFSLPQNKIKEIENLVNNTELSTYFKNDKERKIFSNNMLYLFQFILNRNFKYCMIAMGAIIEFLLKRYCKGQNILPEDYRTSDGRVLKAENKKFVNYVESAIKNNIFDQKKRWEIVQTHLRDFRNYVHLEKEIKSSDIDEQWYQTIVPIFEVLIENFTKQKSTK